MSFKPERPGLEPLLNALKTAAQRGAEVDLIVDAYAFLVNDGKPGPLFYRAQLPKKLPKLYQRRLDILNELKVAGVRCTIINWPKKPFQNPFAGRSHLKFAVINERMYIGGCNLNPGDKADVMVGWDDKNTADWLYGLSQKIISKRNVKEAVNYHDLSFEVDAGSNLLFDAGVADRSRIYEAALDLIDSAQKEVLLTCQFFPNSVTARHLRLAAERGTKVTIIYNHPSAHPFPMNILHSLVTRYERLRCPKSFFKHELPKGHPYLHAKVLVSEKAAMVGSHNYVTAGVRFGTAEIALHRTDQDFAHQLIATINQQLS
jgi:cardiolipin synthase